jgi:hypothetical protein
MEGTGWSKAHKISLWARTLDGQSSYGLVQSMLKGGNSGILENLLDSHGGGTGPGGSYTLYPIFQIDGNFGLTAGMIEMLIQSQLGYTQFLPAIPQEWNTGKVDGLVARGNFVIGMDWKDGKANYFTVASRNGGVFTGEYKGIQDFVVKDNSGREISVSKPAADKISFDTVAGRTYTIGPKGAVVPPPPGPGPSKPDTAKDTKPVVKYPDVKSIRTPLSTIYLTPKRSVKLPIVLDDAKGKPVGDTLKYSSSNKKVATVSAAGRVTAKKAGKSTITIKARNGKAKKVNVRVVKKAKKLKKVAVKKWPAKSRLKAGKSYILKLKLTPSKATNLKVTFKSSKASGLKIDKAGKLTALKSGKYTVTIKVGSKQLKKRITVVK